MLSVVDLFAGCGGLSLGLELAGFEPVLVAELSESARKTYLANRTLKGDQVQIDVSKLAKLSASQLRALTGLPKGARPTLVAGGPPCQGFSGIGHRRTHSDVERHEIVSNHLYKEMVTVIKRLEPEVFLFENVKGLLSARWHRDSPDRVWEDVRLHFLEELGDQYVIAYSVVHAYDYGIAQNRPRVLMLGLRREHWDSDDRSLSSNAINELTKINEPIGLEVGLLPPPAERIGFLPNLRELLGDLVADGWDHATTRATRPAHTAYASEAVGPWQKALRAKFVDNRRFLKADAELHEQEYSRHSAGVRERFDLIRLGKILPVHKRTKKFAQRLIPAEWGDAVPKITIASLPDDYVHWAQPRSFTVREWARMQGFPDWYVFHGPRTTGGHRRAGDVRSGDSVRETPKYTQIGNAIPVPLGAAIGWHIRSLLGVPSSSVPTELEQTRYAKLLREHFAGQRNSGRSTRKVEA